MRESMDYFAIWLALRVCRRQNCLYWEDSWEVIETSKTRNGNLVKIYNSPRGKCRRQMWALVNSLNGKFYSLTFVKILISKQGNAQPGAQIK